MRSAMRRLQQLENKKKRDRRVVFEFHLNDGRVVNCAKNELPETAQLAEDISSSISAKPTYTYEEHKLEARVSARHVRFASRSGHSSAR